MPNGNSVARKRIVPSVGTTKEESRRHDGYCTVSIIRKCHRATVEQASKFTAVRRCGMIKGVT
ncbi:hypothetical protein UA08_08249 [Talaromyces atroroseus]|uniref:Uncharacterized protein n=1 Tax=Talaromyces atroroseus TaxID=1441469 RepID=A0A225AM80_TALAT|nr:hypothetical protein UA08_08249 [Talaromyces atroroseus]OKL56679.1 hypothetical protein UA08_08249 [Talaromyces atroroseus]